MEDLILHSSTAFQMLEGFLGPQWFEANAALELTAPDAAHAAASKILAVRHAPTKPKSAARIHRLKTWPEYFVAIWNGLKPFEIRVNDRDYQVGDLLVLQEWNPNTSEFTGREVTAPVIYLTTFNQASDTVVMALGGAQRFLHGVRV